MLKEKFLRAILLISIAALAILPLYSLLFVSPSFTKLLAEDSEDDAVRIGKHIAKLLLSDLVEFNRNSLPAHFPDEAEVIRKDLGLMKIKVFSPSGEIIFSSDTKDIGHINEEKYFHEVVARGNTYTKVVKKDDKSLERQTVTADVVETYVPIMRGDKFAGAFEIYLDITRRKSMSDRLISQSHAILFVIALGLLTAVILNWFKANKSIAARKQAEEQIIRQSSELETINTKLSALFEVSSAISRTIDLDKLLISVLDTVTQLKIFDMERKGGVFIVEGNKMRLIAHLGHSEAFLELHKDMKVGDCLCGLVAKTGQIIISNNSNEDTRHTISYPEMTPHGHICVPLMATNRLVGVLYLYLPPGFDIDERKTNMLVSIGSQIGIAIENARLYEETRLLSLHDHLTGLANRRFMDVVLDRSFAETKRYGHPISAIMLDIDYFKKFNDTHGHLAGDRLLADLAALLLRKVRDVDLVVRYGGEEFLVLLPKTGLSEASEAAERIRESVAAELGITVSLGVSFYKQGMRQEDLITMADAALYQAKQGGRDQVRVNS